MSANTYLPATPLIPGFLLISAITNAYPMVVTIIDSIYNSYVAGSVVFFSIPSSYGMFQLNSLSGQITEINGDDFSIDIDSRQFDLFTIPNPVSLPTPSQPATLSPAGARNTFVPPITPFQSLYNQGN